MVTVCLVIVLSATLTSPYNTGLCMRQIALFWICFVCCHLKVYTQGDSRRLMLYDYFIVLIKLIFHYMSALDECVKG